MVASSPSILFRADSQVKSVRADVIVTSAAAGAAGSNGANACCTVASRSGPRSVQVERETTSPSGPPSRIVWVRSAVSKVVLPPSGEVTVCRSSQSFLRSGSANSEWMVEPSRLTTARSASEPSVRVPY